MNPEIFDPSIDQAPFMGDVDTDELVREPEVGEVLYDISQVTDGVIDRIELPTVDGGSFVFDLGRHSGNKNSKSRKHSDKKDSDPRSDGELLKAYENPNATSSQRKKIGKLLDKRGVRRK